MRPSDDPRYRDKLARRSTRVVLKSLIRRRRTLPPAESSIDHPSPVYSYDTYSTASSEKELDFFEHIASMQDSSPSPPLLAQSRPPSITMPIQPLTVSGPYCVRRPKLIEILEGQSAPPWTLSALSAYMSQTHCLELLEFKKDTDRYRRHYRKASKRSPEGQIAAGSSEANFMKDLWCKLVDAYIAPNGPREINIPSDVRDRILRHNNDELPPQPSTLDPAVGKVMELMEDSVLGAFLNSVSPNITMESGVDTLMTDADDSNIASPQGLTASNSHEDRHHGRSPRFSRRASPPILGSSPQDKATKPSNRASAPSHSFSQFARNFGHSSRHGHSSHHGSTSTPHDTHWQSSASMSNPASARNSTAAITPFADMFHVQHESTSSSTPNGSSTSSPMMASAPFPPPASNRASRHANPPRSEVMPEASTTAKSSRSSFAKLEPMTPPTTPPMSDVSGLAFGDSPVSVTSGAVSFHTAPSPRAQAISGITQMFSTIEREEVGQPKQAPHPYTAFHHQHVSFQEQSQQQQQAQTSTHATSSPVAFDHSRRSHSQSSIDHPMTGTSAKNTSNGSITGGVNSAAISRVSVNSSNGGSSVGAGEMQFGSMSTWKRVRSSFFGKKKSNDL